MKDIDIYFINGQTWESYYFKRILSAITFKPRITCYGLFDLRRLSLKIRDYQNKLVA